MKRKGKYWRVDWSGRTAPEVGQVVGYMSPTGIFSCARITSVRVVKNRTPLPPGSVCRYSIGIERIEAVPMNEVAWTCYAYTRNSKPVDGNPFDNSMSPLL